MKLVLRYSGVGLFLILLGYACLYLWVADSWKTKLDLKKKWKCEGVYFGVSSNTFFFPNRGGVSGPKEITSVLQKCPEIHFDPEKETLFISKGRELQSMSIRPLYKWRLDKTWTYGYPIFKTDSLGESVYVYAIERNDIGFPQ